MVKKLPRPFDDWSTYPGHSGIDFPVARNTPIPASGNGVVVFAGYYSLRGGYAVHIQYDDNAAYKWGYYHIDNLANIKVKLHDKVKLGTIIALSGGLGQYSTGPHLHQDVWANSSTIAYPPKYWDYVDKADNGYVGAANTAGDGSKPLLKDEDEMFVAVKGKTGVRTNSTWVTKNGKSHKISNSRLLVGAVVLTTDAEIEKFFALYPKAK